MARYNDDMISKVLLAGVNLHPNMVEAQERYLNLITERAKPVSPLEDHLLWKSLILKVTWLHSCRFSVIEYGEVRVVFARAPDCRMRKSRSRISHRTWRLRRGATRPPASRRWVPTFVCLGMDEMSVT